MKLTIASFVLVFIVFPALALGETVKMKDLVKTNGLLWQMFNPQLFTGKVEKKQAHLRKENSSVIGSSTIPTAV